MIKDEATKLRAKVWQQNIVENHAQRGLCHETASAKHCNGIIMLLGYRILPLHLHFKKKTKPVGDQRIVKGIYMLKK